jgi:hypothetical protein
VRTLAVVEECPNVPGRCAVGLGMQQLRQVGPTILNSFKGKEPVCVPRGDSHAAVSQPRGSTPAGMAEGTWLRQWVGERGHVKMHLQRGQTRGPCRMMVGGERCRADTSFWCYTCSEPDGNRDELRLLATTVTEVSAAWVRQHPFRRPGCVHAAALLEYRASFVQHLT